MTQLDKFPTKTTIGAGILLLLFWHGKGFGGFGKGKGPRKLGLTELGLVPIELQKLLLTEPNGTRPVDTIQLMMVQRGGTFTGKDTPQDFVLAKSPGIGEALSMAELLSYGDWFRRGRLNLVIRDNGAILHGNMMLIQRKLSEAGIPAIYLTSIWNEKLGKFEWGQPLGPQKAKVKDLRAIGYDMPTSFPDDAEITVPILRLDNFDFRALTS